MTLTLFGVATSSPAAAQSAEESVLLPYTCAVERGRVTLTPSAERAYKIIGPHASHAFTACRPGQPDLCRTWQLHKFDLTCGTVRVSWLAVVAAGLERTPRRGRIEAGRLVLRMGPVWGRAGLISPMLTLPPGYAPSAGLQARFVGGTATPPTVIDARPTPAPKEMRPNDSVAMRADLTRSEAQAPSEPALDGWLTTVQTDVAGPWRLSIGRALGGLGLVLAAWAVLMLARRRMQASAILSPPAASMSEADDAALCAELIARAVNLHRASRDALGAVPSDTLRQLLSDDLSAVQRLLLAPTLTANVADGHWPAVKPVVAAAMTDLERVARIIDGVLSSAPAVVQRDGPSLPHSAAEAFELLGINPDASRTVIKKVVDGLRQSWHPDHARNDNDRVAREERLKQINVAWDLIRRDRPSEPAAA